MCARCDLIDYPIADCWRPCYVPRPARPSLDVDAMRIHSGQDHFEAAETIVALRHIIKDQRARQHALERENEALRLLTTPTGHDASRQSFEGID